MNNETIDNINTLINNASNVFVMGHRGLDLDALATCLSLYYLCESLGKKTYIIYEEQESDITIKKALDKIQEKNIDIKLYKYNEISTFINTNSLLFIVDCHKKELTQVPNLYDDIMTKIIIDHHNNEGELQDINLCIINSNYSSTCEIISDLMYSFDYDMPPYIYSIMLGGIMIDTSNFSRRTNDNTYITAANLIKLGATSKEVQHLLKEDLLEYFNIQEIVQNVIIINQHFAICTCKETIYDKEFLAKVSSTLLKFENIEMSFCVGRISDEVIGISCRSIGNYDASLYMQMLSGGGNRTDAATQIKGTNVEIIKDEIINIIREERK